MTSASDDEDLGSEYMSMDDHERNGTLPSLWVEDDHDATWANAVLPRKNRALLISACGNFACAYNFQSIDYALHSLCEEYPVPTWALSTVPSAAFYGAITGQLSLGYAGDCIGRRRAMILTLSLVACGALGSALFTWGGSAVAGDDNGLYYVLYAFEDEGYVLDGVYVFDASGSYNHTCIVSVG